MLDVVVLVQSQKGQKNEQNRAENPREANEGHSDLDHAKVKSRKMSDLAIRPPRNQFVPCFMAEKHQSQKWEGQGEDANKDAEPANSNVGCPTQVAAADTVTKTNVATRLPRVGDAAELGIGVKRDIVDEPGWDLVRDVEFLVERVRSGTPGGADESRGMVQLELSVSALLIQQPLNRGHKWVAIRAVQTVRGIRSIFSKPARRDVARRWLRRLGGILDCLRGCGGRS